MDPDQIAALLTAGAVAVAKVGEISATEVVKEATKDAYRALKGRLGAICGRGATRALDIVEEDPTSAEARSRLVQAVSQIDAEDGAEVDESCRALLHALRDDPAALAAAAVVASIKIDVESDGKVTIHSLRGARTIDVKARSKDDFTFSNVDMDGGDPGGK